VRSVLLIGGDDRPATRGRKISEAAHNGGHTFDGIVYILAGGEAAEAEAGRGHGLIVWQADCKEHWRGRDRAGGACRARGTLHSLQVE